MGVPQKLQRMVNNSCILQLPCIVPLPFYCFYFNSSQFVVPFVFCNLFCRKTIVDCCISWTVLSFLQRNPWWCSSKIRCIGWCRHWCHCNFCRSCPSGPEICCWSCMWAPKTFWIESFWLILLLLYYDDNNLLRDLPSKSVLVWQRHRCVHWVCMCPVPLTTLSNRSILLNRHTFTSLQMVSWSTLMSRLIPCKLVLLFVSTLAQLPLAIAHLIIPVILIMFTSFYRLLPSLLTSLVNRGIFRGGRINVDNLLAGIEWSKNKAAETPGFKVSAPIHITSERFVWHTLIIQS